LRNEVLNFVGGIPDRILGSIPDITIKKSVISKDEYLERLAFYSDERFPGQDGKFFSLPDSAPDAKIIEERPFMDGVCEVHAFGSRYEVQNPKMEEDYKRHEANLTSYMFLWKHKYDKPRPLVLCIHGYMMGTPEKAIAMFRIKKLYELGLNVALHIQPFHWKRQGNFKKSILLNPNNVPLSIENFGQNIHDLHSAVLYLKSLGHEKTGTIGASLGGFTSAQYATKNPPLDFMFMVVPAIDFWNFFTPSSKSFSFNVDDEVIKASRKALEIVTPLHLTPAYDVEKIGVVMHAGDRLCNHTVTRKWIDMWGIKNFKEVVGGHWLYFDKDTRGREWYGWLAKHGYINPKT
jgi:pimeloyl-ACP methyl ester carboxylesterase